MRDPRFTQAGSAFAMTCTVEVNIQADAQLVWCLLTDAKGFARWNSTVTRIEGDIREGKRITPVANSTAQPQVNIQQLPSVGRTFLWRTRRSTLPITPNPGVNR